MLADLDTGELREVDVVVESVVNGEVVTIGIEVVGWSRRATVPRVEMILGKHQRLPTHKVVLVSWSGFTEPALRKVEASGKAVALTPQIVDDQIAGKFFVDQFQARINRITLVVNGPDDAPVIVRCEFGDNLLIHGSAGEELGRLEQLASHLCFTDETKSRIADELHAIEDKSAIGGFSFDFGELAPDTGYFIRWEDDGTLQRILGLRIEGSMSAWQSEVTLRPFLLGSQTAALAEATMFGLDAVFVASPTDERSSRLSWRLLNSTDQIPSPGSKDGST